MAKTTLIHIGDFHAAPGPRNADRYRWLDFILDQGERVPHLGAWLWPGDLSHQRQAIEDKNQLAARLQRMASRAPILICYGNHDLPGDLDVFDALRAEHPIYVVAQPQVIRFRLATGQWASCFCLPYPTKASLVAAGVVPADVGDVAADALEAIFIGAAYDLEQARDNGDLTFVMGHINVGGSITSTGQPNIGREIELAPRHLERLAPIYIGLNHIHKHQTIAGAHYAGSVCRLDWGEIDDKFYNRVTIKTDDIDGDTVLVEPQPIPVPKMFHVEGDLTREGFVIAHDAGDEIDRRFYGNDWTGTEVRVRYHYKQSEKAALDEALVAKAFRTALRLKIEPVAIPDRAVRAPAVAAAHTLADKIAAWADVVGVTPAPTLVDKLARLEQTDPATLFKQLTHEINALEDVEVPF